MMDRSMEGRGRALKRRRNKAVMNVERGLKGTRLPSTTQPGKQGFSMESTPTASPGLQRGG